MIVARPKTIPLLPILIGTVLLTVPFHLSPDNFIVDDGYFYPQIARSIADGQGSTFNGIMPTNGYHPLWMLVCVLGALITQSSSGLIQLLTLIQDALILVSVSLLVTISRAAAKRGAVAGCAVFLFFNAVLGIWRLLEANLALALQMVVLPLIVPIFPSIQQRLRGWRPLLVGLLLGLTLLARLDLIFFVAVVLSYELLHNEGKTSLTSRAAAVIQEIVVAALLLAPYLVWNLRKFHHMQPISGAIKSTFPHMQRLHIPIYAVPVVGAVLLSSLLLLKRERTEFDALCLLTAAASALHLGYTLLFGALAPWYLTTGYLCVALCGILLADGILSSVPSMRWLEYAFAASVFLSFLLLSSLRLFSNFTYSRLTHGQISFHKSYVEPKRAFAMKLRETLPAGSRIFIFDAPGGVAYYSGLSVLPADGLVTDYTYNADLARDGFARYAMEHHLDYFVTPDLQPGQIYDRALMRGKRTEYGQVMEIQVPLTSQDAGTITLPDADLLFRFRQINPDLEATMPEIGVWRIRHEGSVAK